jgi:hypothetical protein
VRHGAPAPPPALDRLGCTISTSEPIAIASPGSDGTRAPDPACDRARGCRSRCQVFDLDVVTDMQPDLGRGRLSHRQGHVARPAPPPRPMIHLAARGQGERRELLRSHDQQVKPVAAPSPSGCAPWRFVSSVLGVATLHCNATRCPSPPALRPRTSPPTGARRRFRSPPPVKRGEG